MYSLGTQMIFDFDAIVIGAGVVGLSVARSLAEAGKEVLVLEASTTIGAGISSRNSEVIHAGIYYPYNSTKHKLCLSGRRLLVEYCESRNVEYQILGKLIVANSKRDIFALTGILNNGIRNGVSDLRMVYKNELSELEPRLRAQQAILSPSTGIIDSHGLMLALQGDLERSGGLVSCHSPVSGIRVVDGGFCVTAGSSVVTEVTCKELINSGGLDAPKISRMLNGPASVDIPVARYCKGTYFSLSTKSPFSRLIYPAPNDAGLGIHFTLDLAGRARFGPDTEWVETPSYDVSCKRKAQFFNAISDFYPDLREEDLTPDYAGVRPKIVGAGEPAADFNIQFSSHHKIPGYVALYGIESPGLTAALAIGELVKKNLLEGLK